ncbi:G-protein coupled receptor 4-like [Larimichthys crocea]|uniref:G-protein coupled receptor 4-like n=1 Tax=Larimichthys crocea TaxID=215358 RepID=UPI000F5F4966|nr:G-protein coupled receptor 4-like [Larimichthys crocea]XP_027131691.1 G-protein coupled receptor 4-like [Larimichthys crocea]
MEDLHMNNTSQEESFDYSNTYNYDYDSNNTYDYDEKPVFITDVVTYIIVGVGLPLTLVAIYALYSQVRNGQVAPIYVINLLISDIIQFCCMIAWNAPAEVLNSKIVNTIYDFCLLTSVGFMVCVALERYLVVAWPLWYRFRRTIKTSVVVCVLVWVIPTVSLLTLYFLVDFKVLLRICAIYLLLPFPLLIFFLGGTLKALSASTVPSDEKRRIVGVLVLVLLIYTLLFMPNIIWFLSEEAGKNFTFTLLSGIFLRLSPLADLFLYVFMRKGIIDKLLASVCCCRMDSNDISRSSGNDDNIHTVSSV